MRNIGSAIKARSVVDNAVAVTPIGSARDPKPNPAIPIVAAIIIVVIVAVAGVAHGGGIPVVACRVARHRRIIAADSPGRPTLSKRQP
jgi:hypothetical protein